MKRAFGIAVLLFAVYFGLCAVNSATDGKSVSTLLSFGEATNHHDEQAEGASSADRYAADYPQIVASMQQNADNTYRVSYIEEDPYITTLYAGYGFAKDYTSAVGHAYTLEDVSKTERPHPLANCLTCKTPDFTKLVNEMGEDAYSLDFEETFAQMHETISCYNCHGDDIDATGGVPTVTHSYVTKALGDNAAAIKPATLSCGQCHIEYYFDPDTKATSMPYDSVEAMSPEAILAYYDSIDFADWTQESTGVRLVKAQHPEMETFLGAGSIHSGLLTCSSCHMAKVEENGTTYTSHYLESPLNNETILASCAACHGDTDIKAKVADIQATVTAREKEVGEKLKAYNDLLAEKTAAGEESDALTEARALYRSAQWYWDFVYVENSEGAHNSTLAKSCLDKAEALADEGMALISGGAPAAEEAPTDEAPAEEAPAEEAPAADEGPVKTAEEWAETFPQIAASMAKNADNTYRVSYIEEDPYITTLYAGYGFAKDYTSAVGHAYTLEDVSKTERPHPLANCLTCKTPDFTKLVNDMGEAAYSLDFEETFSQMHENISCYNCHGNDILGAGGVPTVTHSYVTKALGDNAASIKPATLSCGQCHIEYYFDPETKATSMPYDSVAAMSPEAILEYYNSIDFADWTQEATGARLIKAQHPEMETFLGTGSIHAGLLTCSSCHMAKTEEDGVKYTSHYLESPLNNETILASCAACHGDTDIKAKVADIQVTVTAREKEVGEKLKAFNDKLAEKTAAGEEGEALTQARDVYRSAQWYWDFVYVENSEGAHNSTLAKSCLDKADALADEGMALLA